MGKILSMYQNRYSEITSICKRLIHEELLSKGQGGSILSEKIVVEKMEEDDESFHLIQEGILEHPRGRVLHQLTGVLLLSGYNRDNPTERVDNLLVGWHNTISSEVRLGIRDGNKWIYKSKELPRPQS